MAERNLPLALKKVLINNEPFSYCHLIKFERPSEALLNGTFSTDAVRYAYYTDSTHNVAFDDGSLNMDGNSNGSQNYIADKILDVSSYSETVEARASGMTLTFSAEALNSTITNSAITANASASTLTVPSYIDLVDEGFRDGDKILISGGSMSGKYYRINGIKTNNTVISLGVIDHAVATQSSGTAITLTLASDELKGPLGETNDGSLKSYHNREVFVYKAFLDPDDGTITGSPVLVFKGIINATSIEDNPSSGLRVKWMLTSHWGDFAAVRGRISNDKVHRAADANNRGQPEAAIRPEYAYDLGFMHAEQTTNILAVYTAIEQEQVLKTKKKWFKKKYDMTMQDVEVERDVNLNFSLQAKHIPVIYGVERVAGLPVFVDTKSNDANNIYIVYAISEGEIGGIYDMYVEGSPLICMNKEDSDDRDDSITTPVDGIEVFCRGRQDLGVTLGGISKSGSGVSGSTASNYTYKNAFNGYGRDGWEPSEEYIEEYYGSYHTTNNALAGLTTTITDSNGSGVIHEETIKLDTPNNMQLTLHTGKRDQKADNTLISIAQSPGFKRQNDYFTGDFEYWSPNHRLLDTAYMVLDCEIAEDATTVPEIEYVVRGKSLECYNYDYSYDHSGASSQNATNFSVGDEVTLKRTDTNATLSTVTIIDKWTFTDTAKTVRQRFRFSTAPDLGYTDGVPAITAFYMTDGTNRWDMVTYNHVLHAGTVPSTLSVDVTVSTPANSPLTVATGTNPNWLVGGFLDFSTLYNFKFTDPDESYYLKNFILGIAGTTGTHTGGNSNGATSGTKTIVSADRIKLASGASSSDDVYNGMTIEVTKTLTNSVTGVKEASTYLRDIVDYLGSERVATVSQTWVAGEEPDPDDVVVVDGAVFTYRLLPKLAQDDKRVSINPAIQLLDYMTSPRYGKGLSIEKDLSMTDFLQAARTCDSRGTQTLCGSKTPTVGDRYVLTSDGTASGSVVAMGLVKSVGDFTDSAGTDYTEFQEVYGKFTKSFMKNSHSYVVGDIVYTGEATGYYRCTQAGAKSVKPTHVGGGTSNGFIHITAIPLYKIAGGTISSTVANYSRVVNSKYANPLAEYNAANKSFDTGYSLFDSDFVKYWRYLGWNSHHQREVTRHQTSCVVDTSQSVFENINSFLGNFNGLLSYEAGKYALRIETTSDAIVSDIATSSDTGYTIGAEINPRVIKEEDIIGTIQVDDKGPAKSYNTVSTSIIDPGNQFKGTAVTFYDSNYVRADKNVIKSGTVNVASVSSYYNARINVENFLRKSRFGMTISFKIGPKALLLIPGDTISVSHDRFGFNLKKFRITNISYQKDCSATIQASEYDDSFYTISKPALPSVSGNDQRTGIQASPGAPSGLSATAKAIGSIDLSWTNTSSFTDNMFTEIWVSVDSNSANRTLLHKTSGATRVMQHNVGEDGAQRYYWIRHGKSVVLASAGQNRVKTLYSGFHGSANATTVIPSSLYDVILESDAPVFVANSSGVLQTPSAINFTTTRHNLSGSVSFSSSPSVTLTGSGDTRALSIANMGSNTSVVVTATVTSTTAERNAGAENSYSSISTIGKVSAGAAGAALTISSTTTNGAGNTVVTFSDGSTATIAKGDDGTTQGVKVAYASDANGTNKSFTQGSLTFVKYHEYTGTAPVIGSSVFDSGYVQFIGGDGTSSGVKPIYASNSSGTGASFTQGSLTFVNFYEWTGSEPSSVPSGLTYVKFIGTDGTSVTGATGPRTTTFRLNYTAAASTGPTAPTSSNTNSYNFSNGTLGTILSGWSHSTPTYASGNSNKYWYVDVTVVEATFGGTQTISFGSTTQAIGFSGLVTFSGAALTDGSTTKTPIEAGDVNSNVTSINGGVITTGTLNANRLEANTTTSNTLNVGSSFILNSSGKMHSTDKTTFADTDAGFYMDGTGDLHVGNATNYIKFDVSAGTIALKASTIQLGSSNVSTFDGAYGSLSGAPTLFDEAYASLSGLPTLLNTITLPDGTEATVSGSNVTITRSGLNIDSSYLNSQGAAVFGSTSLSGGRIRLLSTGAMSFTTTSSATTLDGGGIDINAHTQQIIISDSS